MFYELKPEKAIHAQRGNKLRTRNWESEAALRMLENNLDPENALIPDELIVYGGSGRAVRNWKCYRQTVDALHRLEADETLLMQSGKPVGVVKTHPYSPRLLIANSNIVPKWSTQENFDKYDQMGLTMYGQMTAGSWIYIGTQGILQGTYQTLAALAEKHFASDLRGKWVLTGGLGAMSGAQPLAVTMNNGVIINIEVDPVRAQRRVDEGYCMTLTTSLEKALSLKDEAVKKAEPLSIALVGNCADIIPGMLRRDIIPDIVTDQTSAHNLLDYVPSGDLEEVNELKEKDPETYKKRSLESICRHTQAILGMQKKGAIAFDYGNNLRGQAELAGLEVRGENGKFLYPGFVPAYIRPLFCKGRGPFRWVALSGDVSDIHKLDDLVLELFPHDEILSRWIALAREQVPQLGLPNRVCWLGLGERAKFALRMNEMVANGELKAPIVIGRDHLDCGSVASPNRETEDMRDGSDAIADWPLLNALVNTACGADWVSLHNGGGVGIGNSTHAGQVIVATGTKEKAERLQRALDADPAMGIFRHVDAGYEHAKEFAKKHKVNIPSMKKIEIEH
ncbi:MAG: urocanate hydratase [Candidatus Marinimicrobia bacterium]|nr:urocanate hydratase [Candidatus Neomarinimicrobiota bacterium]